MNLEAIPDADAIKSYRMNAAGEKAEVEGDQLIMFTGHARVWSNMIAKKWGTFGNIATMQQIETISNVGLLLRKNVSQQILQCSVAMQFHK